MELAVGIAAGVAKDDFSDALRNTLRNSMKNYTLDEGDRLAWDNVQKRVIWADLAGMFSGHPGMWGIMRSSVNAISAAAAL